MAVISAILLASSLMLSNMNDQEFSLSLPHGVYAEEATVNFETDSYKIVETNESAPLLTITAGGGAYDLRHFQSVCLDHRKAWRKTQRGSGVLIFGSPGYNAVELSYTELSATRAKLAEAIIARIHVKTGNLCSAPSHA